jgi:hypothetical protein
MVVRHCEPEILILIEEKLVLSNTEQLEVSGGTRSALILAFRLCSASGTISWVSGTLPGKSWYSLTRKKGYRTHTTPYYTYDSVFLCSHRVTTWWSPFKALVKWLSKSEMRSPQSLGFNLPLKMIQKPVIASSCRVFEQWYSIIYSKGGTGISTFPNLLFTWLVLDLPRLDSVLNLCAT